MVEEFNKAPESLSTYIRKAISDFFAAIRAMLIRNGFIEPKNISAAELSALAQYGLKLNRSEKPNGSKVKQGSGNVTLAAESETMASKKSTITIDGVERPITNSEGKPIHPTEEGIRNFYKWFRSSKITDDQERPLVVYHGTGKVFNKFDGKKTSDGNFWFTSSKEKLISREAGAANHGEIMPVYLSAKKLAGWDEYDKLSIDEMVSQGYDGIILDDDYVVFNPNQIKSAAGNTGDFSPSNNDIRYSKAQPSADIASTPARCRKSSRMAVKYANPTTLIYLRNCTTSVRRTG
jgi:hypothetical protein